MNRGRVEVELGMARLRAGSLSGMDQHLCIMLLLKEQPSSLHKIQTPLDSEHLIPR